MGLSAIKRSNFETKKKLEYKFKCIYTWFVNDMLHEIKNPFPYQLKIDKVDKLTFWELKYIPWWFKKLKWPNFYTFSHWLFKAIFLYGFF